MPWKDALVTYPANQLMHVVDGSDSSLESNISSAFACIFSVQDAFKEIHTASNLNCM